MSFELKIRAKHLAAESKIIRFEEHKTKAKIKKLKERSKKTDSEEIRKWKAEQGFKLASLQEHRKTVVRPAARRTHLARAYLKGLAYKDVEQKLTSKPPLAYEGYDYIGRNVKQIAESVTRYGKKTTPEEIRSWILA